MIFIYLFILFITIATVYYYKKDLLSPIRLYIGIYSFLLTVDSLKLSDYQVPWSLTTHLLFWGASGLFIAGCSIMLLVNKVNNSFELVNFDSIKKTLKNNAQQTDWNWFFYIWLLCSFIFLISYFVSYLITGFIPLFTGKADTARLDFFSANFFANIGLFFGPLSLMLSIEQLFFSNIRGKQKIFIWLLSALVLFLYFTIVTRLDLFRVVIFAIVLYHYGKKKLSPLMLLYALLFSVVFFFVFFILRIKSDALLLFTQTFKIHMPKELLVFSGLYTYIVTNFWNLNYAITQYIDGYYAYPMGYGFDLLRPFLFFLKLEPALVSTYGFDTIYNESIVMVKGLNTVVYMWPFYKDFGILGVYLLPLLLGLLCTSFYINTLYKPTLFRISLWGIFVGFILISYHGPLWELWFVYMNIFFLAIAHKKIGLSN